MSNSQKQNAPTVGQGDEGSDQNPEGTIMTSVTEAATIREARAAAAKSGTVAADPDIRIKDAPDHKAQTRTNRERAADVVSLRDAKLAEEVLAHAPLFIVQSTNHVLVWRSGTGTWFRRGGSVGIRKWHQADGARAFVVFLHVGANEDDLKNLLHAVEKARRGEGLNEWRRANTPEADDLTFTLQYTSFSYGDPYVYGDRSPKVSVCDERQCVHKWHTEYGEHVMDSLDNRLTGGSGFYTLSVYRPLDEDEWKVSVYTDEFFGTPDDVAKFVNDLQWMTEECRRANMKAVAA